MRSAVLVQVLEQFLPRQLLAAAHHAGHARVVQGSALLHAAFAAKAQLQRAAAHGGVARAQRGQAVGAVADRIFLVAHAHIGGVQQPHDGRQHARARQQRLAPARCQVACHLGANARQRPAKGRHALELVRVAQLAPLRVVAVLAAPARVQPGGLQVALGQRADPHLGVGRRNGQAADAFQFALIAQPVAVGLAVAKALAPAHAPQARHVALHIDQAARQALARRRAVWRASGRRGQGRGAGRRRSGRNDRRARGCSGRSRHGRQCRQRQYRKEKCQKGSGHAPASPSHPKAVERRVGSCPVGRWVPAPARGASTTGTGTGTGTDPCAWALERCAGGCARQLPFGACREHPRAVRPLQ